MIGLIFNSGVCFKWVFSHSEGWSREATTAFDFVQRLINDFEAVNGAASTKEVDLTVISRTVWPIALVLAILAGPVPPARSDAKSDREIKERLQDLKMFRAEKSYYEDVLAEPDSWLSPKFIPRTKNPHETFKVIVAIPREKYIRMLTIGYYRDLLASGRRFDRADLTHMIKRARDYSQELRVELTKKLDRLNQDIAKLEAEARSLMDARRDLSGYGQCRTDSWRSRWRVTANVRQYLDQTTDQKKFLDNPGWKQRPQRLGDANPPTDPGVIGVRYMHPLDGARPAVQEGVFDLTGVKRLRVRVSGNCNINGDFELRLKVDGQPRGTTGVDCGWREVAFDLAGYQGRHTVALEVQATGWLYEYAFFDCIVFE